MNIHIEREGKLLYDLIDISHWGIFDSLANFLWILGQKTKLSKATDFLGFCTSVVAGRTDYFEFSCLRYTFSMYN